MEFGDCGSEYENMRSFDFYGGGCTMKVAVSMLLAGEGGGDLGGGRGIGGDVVVEVEKRI